LVTACDASNCVERVIDLEVKALPDLIIEEIRTDNLNPVPGDILAIKVMVRNSGQVKAEMISVRCLVDDSTIDIGTIPILNPGELGSVSCDMQVPQDDSVIRLSAIVDIGEEIDEKIEDNNEGELILAIGSTDIAINDDVESFTLPSAVAWGSTIAVVLLIITLFAFFAPSKIKRLD
jgi:subtilase family serine protease